MRLASTLGFLASGAILVGVAFCAVPSIDRLLEYEGTESVSARYPFVGLASEACLMGTAFTGTLLFCYGLHVSRRSATDS